MKTIISISAALFLSIAALAQTKQSAPKDSLYGGFLTPSNSARPRVWWHWMNGNITKEGIQKDLEWMKRIGIGGFENVFAGMFTPPRVKKKKVFMITLWKDGLQLPSKIVVINLPLTVKPWF